MILKKEKVLHGDFKMQVIQKWLPSLLFLFLFFSVNSFAQDTNSTITNAVNNPIQLTAEEQAWLDAHRKIVVGGGMDWVPFDFVDDKTGNYTGIANDYLKVIGKKLGIEVEIITGPTWDELLVMIRNKEIDVIPAIYHSKKREDFVRFTDSYIKLTEFIFSRSNDETISGFTDLQNKTIVVVKSYTIEGEIRSHYPGYDLITAPTIQDALKTLVTGEADAFIGDIISTSYIIKEFSLVGIKPVASVPFQEPKVHIAVRKDWPVLRNLIDKILKTMPKSEHNEIKTRWMSFAEKKIEGEKSKVALTDKEKSWLDRGTDAKDGIPLTQEEQEWVKTHPVIKTNGGEWAPFIIRTEEGVTTGISTEILNLAAGMAGLKVEYVDGAWPMMLKMLKNGKLDLLQCVSKTPEREKFLHFTTPYVDLPGAIYVQKGNMTIGSVSDLKGKVLAVEEATNLHELFKTNYPDIRLVLVKSPLEGLQKTGSQEADAYIGPLAVTQYVIQKHLIIDLKVAAYIEEAKHDLRLGARSDYKILADILQKALDAVTEDQKMQAITKHIAMGNMSGLKKMTTLTTHQQQRWVDTISLRKIVLYGIFTFMVVSLLAFILIKTLKRENITVSFGSPWFRWLVLSGLTVIVLTVAFLGWYNLERNKTQHLLDVEENLKGLLAINQDRIDLWLGERVSYVARLGRDPKLVDITRRLLGQDHSKGVLLNSDALGDARSFFKMTKDTFPNIGFSIIGPDQVSIGSMLDSNIGTINLFARENPELLQRAFQGKVAFVPPQTSDVHLDNSSKEGKLIKAPTMFFMGPIKDSDEKILAVMTLRVNPWEDFSRSMKQYWRIGTIESYAFNREGTMLSPSRFDDQLREIGLLADNQTGSALNIELRDPGVNMVEGESSKLERSEQPLTHMVSRAIAVQEQMEIVGIRSGYSPMESDMEGYRDYRGVPVYGAWLWNADLGMGLAVEIDVDQALAHYSKTRITVFSILGFTLLLSVGAILFVLIIGERTSRALMEARDTLEDTVTERTVELTDKQELLLMAEERSRLLLNSVGEGIFGVDLDGKVMFINSAASRLLCYEPDELIGEDVHTMIHHSHSDGSPYPVAACPMSKAYTLGKAGTITDEMLWRKDGTGFAVEYTATPILREKEITGAVIAFRDITERIEAERAVKDSEDRLTLAAEAGGLGMWEWRVDLDRAIVSDYWLQLKGLNREMYNQTVDQWFNGLHPDDKDRATGQLTAHLNGETDQFEVEYRFKHPKHGWYWEYANARVIERDAEGNPIRMVGYHQDISDRKKMEAALAAEREELQNKYDELARFRRLAFGREERMIELKKEINTILVENGFLEKYKIR